MKLDIEKIIKDTEIRATSLLDIDYLEPIIIQTYKYIDELEKNKNYLELTKAYYLLGLQSSLKCKINESINYCEKSLQMANKLNNKLWQGKNYSRLSAINFKIGNYAVSRKYFIKAIKLFKEENNIAQITLAYTQRMLAIRWREKNKNIIKEYINKILSLMELWEDKEHGYYCVVIGTTYICFLQEPISSIQYFAEAMRIGEKYKVIEINALVLYYLGSIYLNHIKNPSEAIRNLEPLVYSSKYDFMDKQLKGSSFVALIDAYIDEYKLEDARYCIAYVKEYMKSIKNTLDEGTKIMLIYLQAKLISKGDKNLEKGLIYALNANERYKKNIASFRYTHFDCNINTVIGDLYFKLDDYDKSIDYYKKSIEMSRNWGKSYEKNAYCSLAKVYEYKGDYEEALKNYKICESIFRDVVKEHCFIKYENLQKEFEQIYKEEEIRNLHMHNAMIKEESYKDPLTKLFNRSYLKDIIENNVGFKNINILMIDVDYFKNYNDNYGHVKGDSILISIAKCIKNSCNECNDKVIRYGGEEFLIISYSKDEDYIENLPYNIIKNINKLNVEHKYSPISDKITLSIGVSCGNINSYDDYNILINEADKALYMAKGEGRNTVMKSINSEYIKKYPL